MLVWLVACWWLGLISLVVVDVGLISAVGGLLRG